MKHISNPNKITPVTQIGSYWVKRDDLFMIGDQRGGKVRTCLAIVKKNKDIKGLVTAGSRSSPQVNIVATIAHKLGLPCRAHTPMGKLGLQVQSAKDKGAIIIQHKAGYNNVIIARCREDAKKTGFLEIPFGMDCPEAVKQTRKQVVNIRFINDIKRIVIPVGSGMTLAGVLWGLLDYNINIPVLGVVVGANPTKRLNKHAPPKWETMVKLVNSSLKYHKEVKEPEWEGIHLDPIYEAKCMEYLQKGDLLWIIGHR